MRCVDPQHVHEGVLGVAEERIINVVFKSDTACTHKFKLLLQISDTENFGTPGNLLNVIFICFWPWKEYFAIFCQSIMSGSYAEYTIHPLFSNFGHPQLPSKCDAFEEMGTVAYSWVNHFLFQTILDLITLGFQVVLWWFNTAMEHDHIGKSSTSWRISHVFFTFPEPHDTCHYIRQYPVLFTINSW